jgi:hypothetical protein
MTPTTVVLAATLVNLDKRAQVGCVRDVQQDKPTARERVLIRTAITTTAAVVAMSAEVRYARMGRAYANLA